MIHKNFKDFVQAINEVHYEDTYGDEFKKFIDKYTKLVKSKAINADEYFVHFSNNRTTDLDKNAFISPDHKDPIGTYAYPLSYVLNYPADIWYGKSAKTLFVLKDKSRRKLVLNTITDEAGLYNVLQNLGYDRSKISEYLAISLKEYADKNKGKNKWAKHFMSLLQMNFDKPPIKDDYGTKYEVRSGDEQTVTLRKKFDAIQDISTTAANAIINEREPEQIVFLNRYAYNIEEIYYLHFDNKRAENITSMTPEDYEIKLVASITQFMGDYITSNKPERASLGGWSYYWTKKGRRIEVMFSRDAKYFIGKKLGEKKHKEDKKFDAHDTSVIINSEYGKIHESFTEDSKFSEITELLKIDWDNLVKDNKKSDWTAETRELYLEKREKKKKEDSNTRLSEEEKADIADIPNRFEAIKHYADKHNLPFVPSTLTYNNLKLYRAYDTIINLHASRKFDKLEDVHDFMYGKTASRFFGNTTSSEQLKAIIYDVYKNNPSFFKELNIYYDFRKALEA